MTRRLLVMDRSESRALGRAADITSDGDEWWILLLGDSPTLFARRERQRLDRLGRWQLVPLERWAQAAHEETAEFVTSFVRDLRRIRVRGRELGSLLGRWWYLETTEKSPFRSAWIGVLYRIALIDRVVEASPFDEVLIASVDGHLRELLAQQAEGGVPVRMVSAGPRRARSTHVLLRYWRSAFLEARRLAITLLALRVLGPRVGAPPPGAIAVYTTYPYFWIDPTGPRATERFLPVLPTARSWFLAWLDDPAMLWERRTPVADVFRRQRIVPVARWLRPLDVLAILAPAAFFRLLRYRSVRNSINGRFRGRPIGPLIAQEIEHSLSSPQIFYAELLDRAMRRFARECRPEAVLYRLELQPWENAIVLGLRGSTRSIGFRHTPFGDLYLPLRIARDETATRPLPDAILVSGPIGVERMRAQGYPEGRTAVCGPQRHPKLIRAARRTARRGDGWTVYVAISTVLEETIALLGALAEASSAVDATFVIRTHPALPMTDDALARLLADAGLHGRWSFAPRDLYEGMLASDVLVTVPSTLAFEAIVFGITPIVFENPGTYNANSVAEHGDAFFIARSAGDLSEALVSVRSGSSAANAKVARWPDLIRRVYGDVDTELRTQLVSALGEVGVDVGPQAGK